MQLQREGYPLWYSVLALALLSTAGVTFLYSKVESASHGNGCSTVKLADGRQIKGSLVLDATGHSRRLVEYDKEFNPGFQGAYGIIAGKGREGDDPGSERDCCR